MICNFGNKNSYGTDKISNRVSILVDIYQCHIVENDFDFLWKVMPDNITDEELFEFCRLIPNFLKEYI